MRGGRSLIAPSSDEFCLPHEVFKLGLEHSPLLVYLYLICSKSRKRGADKMSCAAISKAVSLCEKTVRTHLRTLADAGFIKMEHHGRTFSYSLCPIQSKVQEHRSTTRWISRKQAWNTDEVFDAVFPVPAEVFQLDLECGELLVYIYLHYQKQPQIGVEITGRVLLKCVWEAAALEWKWLQTAGFFSLLNFGLDHITGRYRFASSTWTHNVWTLR